MKKSWFFEKLLTTITCSICLAPTAVSIAAAGEIEIDQAKVIAGNITPGDAPGFPATLSQSGKYRLTGNLNVPNGVSGILLAANQITLDLGGFGVVGTGAAGGAAQHGIVTSIPTLYSPVISNGSVTDMGGDGVAGGEYARVTHLNVRSNGGRGIYAIDNAIVSDNVVTENGSNGIEVNRGSRVSDNIVAYNVGDGIKTTGPACIVSNNTIYQNDDGIEIGSGNTNLVSGNSASGNTGFDVRMGVRTGYGGNTLNGGGLGAVSGGINLGHNTCGLAICP